MLVKSIISSSIGDIQQSFHTDFQTKNAELSYSCILALEDDTKLIGLEFNEETKTYTEVRIHLNAGDLVIFRGDFVHAGGSYNKPNLRLHWYLDHVVMSRIHNHPNFFNNLHKYSLYCIQDINS